eukprot:jgi/Phyca11/125228/e_gw1.57.299.1
MHAGPTKVYHVDSMRKAHNSAYAFDILNCTFVHATKPQKSNCADCGLYVLHYMDAISKRIVAEKPSSIEESIAGWTTGKFNAIKASVYRTQLYRALMPK